MTGKTDEPRKKTRNTETDAKKTEKILRQARQETPQTENNAKKSGKTDEPTKKDTEYRDRRKKTEKILRQEHKNTTN